MWNLQITKRQYLCGGLSYFVYFLHVVTHIWKLQCHHTTLFGYGPACPKFSEIIDHQYLWKGVSDFVDFLHSVICILLDIHWSYKNMLFCFGTVSHRLQPTRLSDVLKLKNLKTTWGRKNIMLFWVMDPKNFWCISLQNVLLLTCLTCQSYYMGSIATLHLFFF